MHLKKTMPAPSTKSKAGKGHDDRSKHFCRDVGGKKAYDADIKPTFGSTQALALHSKIWPPHSVVKISFMGGTQDQRAKVIKVVNEDILPYVNLRFKFEDEGGQIRVSFVHGMGAWSMLGNDALGVDPDKATMNLGWLDDDPDDPQGGALGVIKHEFGHGIGAFIHEHQTEVAGIEWNKEKVIADLSGDPNYWDAATIHENMFKRYESDEFRATVYDKDSIMHYAFPETWVLNKDYKPQYNQYLSEQDKFYLRLTYPEKVMDLPRSLTESNVDIVEAYRALLAQTVNDSAKTKCKPDNRVLMIALVCIALMTMVGYFAGKSRRLVKSGKSVV